MPNYNDYNQLFGLNPYYNQQHDGAYAGSINYYQEQAMAGSQLNDYYNGYLNQQEMGQLGGGTQNYYQEQYQQFMARQIAQQQAITLPEAQEERRIKLKPKEVEVKDEDLPRRIRLRNKEKK
jgi:hypothetical protein